MILGWKEGVRNRTPWCAVASVSLRVLVCACSFVVCGCCRLLGGACARWRVCASLRVVVRARCYARGCVRVCGCVWGGLRTCVRGPPPGGVLWRFPTLPHPLGCSTIGAAGLSFQVRNVAGRFPGAVTTTSLCRPPPLLLARRRWVAGCPGRRVASWPVVWWGGGWVGRGSYSGCGVLVLSCHRAPSLSPPGWALLGRGPVRGGLGGLVWCRPISTSRLASASRRFHLWPIDPLFWRGPLTPCWGVETSSRSGLPA